MLKLNVCVLFGGMSPEHEVSLRSAESVLNNMDPEKYNIFPVGITLDGRWLLYEGETEKIRSHEWEKGNVCSAIISPDSKDKALLKFTDAGVEKIKIDVVYPVLHGKFGEDGTIQGLCKLAGIPCVGSGVIGSAVCMDKCIAKILFEKAGIPQARWIELKKGDVLDCEEVEKTLGFPCFIKPSSAGSSFGVTKATNNDELKKGVEIAFEHDYKVLIEEAIDAREVECGVMGNFEPETSKVLGEIRPAKEFYDFEAKYEDKDSALIIPANISEEVEQKIKDYAKKAYKICECRGYSRVDFFIDHRDGRIILNEINTIPGFTPISMYPKVWENSGIEMKDLIEKHINFALDCEE